MASGKDRHNTLEVVDPDRFWLSVKRGVESDCWEWAGYRQPRRGYGLYSTVKTSNHPRRQARAHRIAYMLANGVSVLPASTYVCHACDNPPCCNPGHLYAGDQSTNMTDMWGRDRRRKPTGRNGFCRRKLTEEQVQHVKQRYAAGGITHRALADELGVARETVSRIFQGRNWRWVA
jgi:hypothetical protein